MPETDFTFTNTSEDAYRETVNRNVAGARLSARLWNLSTGNARNINDVVQGSIRVGQSVTAAGKALLSVAPDVATVKIPKYVQELKNAADRARALSDSSILTDTVKKYESYINKLTRGLEPAEVRARYAHLGIRGASRMLVKRLQSNTQEVFDSAVDKWVGRKASYQARVVARNETNEAHWLAGQKVAEDKPYVTGFKWNLGSHPKVDICDSYAGKIFAKGEVPARPHPNCLLPGQRVLMADETEKPIENIRVGEMVIGSTGNPCRILQAFSNRFCGPVYKIGLPGKRVVILTGNHPVYVFERGWVNAEQIKKGTQVFLKNKSSIDMDDNKSPSIFTKVEKLFHIGLRGLGSIMPSSVVNLYGYFFRRDGNINIGSIYSQKWNIRNFKHIKELTNSYFVGSLFAVFLNGISFLLHGLNWLRAAIGIGWYHPYFTFRLASFGPDIMGGLRLIVAMEAPISKMFSKPGVGNSQGFRETINALSSDVSLIGNLGINSFHNNSLYNIAIVESIEKCNYIGNVYNLSVDKDFSYFAEGVLLHNCNCYLTSIFDNDYFKNYTPSAELLQQVRDDPRFPEFKSWATEWLEKTGAGFVAPTIAPAVVPEAVMPEWKPAETIEEAERFIKEQGLAENILYKGEGRGWGGKLSKRKALEKFNAVNKEINDFQQRYGVKLPKVQNFYITSNTRGRATLGPASRAHISFGNEWGDPEWKNVEAWENRTGKKWNWTKEESHRAIIVRHEYAHIIDGELGISRSWEWHGLFNKLGKEEKFWPKDISVYASQKHVEVWTEAFSQYTSPIYGKYKARFPKRLEVGVAPDTTAGMQPAGSKKHPYEIWVMWATKFKNQNLKIKMTM